MFIQEIDYKVVIGETALKVVTQADQETRGNAELEAVEEISGYLRPKYDCKAIFEAAVTQLMADDSISSATREIFRHVVLMHEKPAQVAAEFGTTRNNVDQIKNRMINRLSELVQSMNRPLASP